MVAVPVVESITTEPSATFLVPKVTPCVPSYPFNVAFVNDPADPNGSETGSI